MKKSKIKKELADIKHRLEKLERFASDNTEVTHNGQPFEISYVRDGITHVIKEEFVLPEIWWIAVTKDNFDDIAKWYQKYHTRSTVNFIPNEHLVGMYKEKNRGIKIGFNQVGRIKCNEGFYDFGNEITYEQFKKHVLKEDDLTPVEKALEKPLSIKDVQVDVSVCSEYEVKKLADIFVEHGLKLWNWPFALQVTHQAKYLSTTIEGYGIYVFQQGKNIVTPQQFKEMFGKKPEIPNIRTVQVKVSTEEEARELADVAVSRGEKIWEDNRALIIQEEFGNNYFSFTKKGFYVGKLNNNFQTITIEHFREWYGNPKEIDWSKAGQLVTTLAGTIYRTTGFYKDELFTGVFIQSKEPLGMEFGDRKSNLKKSLFQLCAEPITLQND